MKRGVSYIPAFLPEHIEKDLDDMAAMGVTEVLFALQENNFHILRGALQYGARAAEKRGIIPYAVVWGFANTFGGGRMSGFMLKNTDVWQRTQNGTLIGRACLNNPALIERFLMFTQRVRDNGYKGIFIDEPTPQECFCEYCVQKFKERYNKNLHDCIQSDAYRAFRHEAVAGYTATLCRRVKEFDSSLKTITCLMPRDRELFEQAAAIDDLDVFGTDPYWISVNIPPLSIDDAVACTQEMKELCIQNGKESQVWLGCWMIPAGREEEVYTGGLKLAEVGVDSLYTWSYRGGEGTNEACVQPAKAWASVVKLYKELAGI